MAAESVVRVRVDSEVKEQAAAVLAEMGLGGVRRETQHPGALW